MTLQNIIFFVSDPEPVKSGFIGTHDARPDLGAQNFSTCADRILALFSKES
jgi:hypothetical protein